MARNRRKPSRAADVVYERSKQLPRRTFCRPPGPKLVEAGSDHQEVGDATPPLLLGKGGHWRLVRDRLLERLDEKARLLKCAVHRSPRFGLSSSTKDRNASTWSQPKRVRATSSSVMGCSSESLNRAHTGVTAAKYGSTLH